MMKKRTHRTPFYRRHKPNLQAYVEFDGRRHYLGKHDRPETQRAHHHMVAERIADDY